MSDSVDMELRHLVAYITDDGYIMSYLGVSRGQVQRARKAFDDRQAKSRPPYNRSAHNGTSVGGEAIQSFGAARAAAEQGSLALEQRLRDHFRMLAFHHGITERDAMILCNAGCPLPRLQSTADGGMKKRQGGAS
jgi:hypothetical protein